MNHRTELLYLFELQYICEGYFVGRDLFDEAASEWLALEAKRGALARQVPRGIEHRESFSESVALQGRLWLAIDALLTPWAKASLLLFPGGKAKAVARTRSEHLCTILGITRESPLTDRRLRNAWFHSDEHLDSAVARYTAVTPQSFYARMPDDPTPVLRMITLAPPCITFLDKGTFELTKMHLVVEALSETTARTIESSGERHLDEPDDSY